MIEADDQRLAELSVRLGEALLKNGMMLCAAESCTGGWVAKVVTDTAGSSGWFDRGFVTYANEAKTDMLGVAEETLAAHGAVSERVVREMALGALARSRAGVSVAISGVAGPSGGSAEKPVGTVWFAWARSGEVVARQVRLPGDRDAVRRQSVALALQGILDMVSDG